MASSPSERRNLTQPADWWEAWTAAAEEADMSLSEWIGDQCNRGLTKKQAAKLSERVGKGRPRSDDVKVKDR